MAPVNKYTEYGSTTGPESQPESQPTFQAEIPPEVWNDQPYTSGYDPPSGCLDGAFFIMMFFLIMVEIVLVALFSGPVRGEDARGEDARGEEATYSGFNTHHVLVTRSDKLLWLPTTMPVPPPPETSEYDEDECYNFDRLMVTTSGDGTLAISARFNTGYVVININLEQEPAGYIELNVDISASNGELIQRRDYSAASYTELAGKRLITGDTMGDILAACAEGDPPQDLDVLFRYVTSMEAQEISGPTQNWLEALDSPNWRERETAAAVLKTRLPEVWLALRTADLSAQQRLVLETMAGPLPAGSGVISAVKGFMERGGK